MKQVLENDLGIWDSSGKRRLMEEIFVKRVIFIDVNLVIYMIRVIC